MIDLAELGIRTRVLDAGQGPVVLMLHGNPDNADEWAQLIAKLADRHRCIAPDFPGYGQSPEPPPSFSYSLADQMRFVDAVLQAIGIAEPVILVVHDTGGMVGTAWAAANLDRLRGMVITNTVAFDGFPWFPIARQWGDASPRGRIRSWLGMAALGLRGGALFKRIFGAQCPQLGAEDLERFASSFARNGDAKRTTLRQFRQFMRPGFFGEGRGQRQPMSAIGDHGHLLAAEGMRKADRNEPVLVAPHHPARHLRENALPHRCKCIGGRGRGAWLERQRFQ